MKKAVNKIWILLICILAAGLFAGCGLATPESGTETAPPLQEEEPRPTVGASMMADSLDRAVLRRIDTAAGQLLCYSLTAKQSYVLTYDSATQIQDRYQEELVAAQLCEGDVATLTFIKDSHLARGIFLDDSVTRKDEVSVYELHGASHTMEIGQEQFSLDKDCLILSRGRLMELSDINDSDTLSVLSEGQNVLALVITRGHGYVRLSGADSFEGGFVEFGQSLIRQVERDALYVVPEGAYQMLISKGSDYGVKEITVNPGEELVVDVSDIITDADRTGKIVFTIKPLEAKLYIDEEETSYTNEVELSYGIHQVSVSAEGYKSVTQYIKVGEPMANLSIELEKGSTEEAEEPAESGQESASVSANTAAVTPAAEGEWRVYIDAPAAAELYVDDVYVGIVPCYFAKKSGKHTVSLRREGYINRSYTLDIDDGANDNHYSFSSLKPNTTTSSTDDLVQSALSSLLDGTL